MRVRLKKMKQQVAGLRKKAERTKGRRRRPQMTGRVAMMEARTVAGARTA